MGICDAFRWYMWGRARGWWRTAACCICVWWWPSCEELQGGSGGEVYVAVCCESADACLAAVSLCFSIKSASVALCAGCAKRRVAAASLAIWLPPRRRCVREHERRCGVAAFCVGGVRRLSPAWAASTRVSLRCRWFFAFRCTRSRVGVVFAKPAVAAVSLPIWAPWPPPCQRKPTIGRGVVGDHFVRARRRSGVVFCMGWVCSRVGYM